MDVTLAACAEAYFPFINIKLIVRNDPQRTSPKLIIYSTDGSSQLTASMANGLEAEMDVS